ncbi:ATP-binding cassette sub-family G member 4 [Microplitis demolitor]|uniref:ATP-binding cassette sub-family G member 4 n=1 Tax=Microplitis demolitor TaxID=69319 RepID=UPI0004CD2419|nr:ATP-binding cassette sub-family G member 4 [Microplitis demolitor]
MEVLMNEASNIPQISGHAGDPQSKTDNYNPDNCNQELCLRKAVKEHEAADISFEDLRYKVSIGFRRGTKEILHGIYGRLPAKQLIAIMGPSGAGKSTLLDILSGYRLTGIQGTIKVNGDVRDIDTFRKTSAYITQDDRLQPLLTVSENMWVAADLKLGTNIAKKTKLSIIKEILITLGLSEHVNTRSDRLSGGQKKRLSIALELVNDPTVMFLDEPTTGLDSSTCTQVVNLLKVLARQNRTIVCTIHQPSASLFQLFDHVLILAKGTCLYQGATGQLIPFLESVKLPCPMYHNPADYAIELACGEYGDDKIETLIHATQNGKSSQWFGNAIPVEDFKSNANGMKSNKRYRITKKKPSLQATSQSHQLKVLLYRGYIKCKRDATLTHLRIIVNIVTGIMLGMLFIQAGNEGSRVLENYNLLFAILIHHMMTSMMLTILTFPTELNILKKEHFNRWYTLKMFYLSITIIDIPVTFLCCLLFSTIIYFMSGQLLEIERFSMFFLISLMVVFVAQSFGLMIGAVFNVVNGTFAGPTLSVPMMMFAGFGVTLRDLPSYLKWGSYISYLRFGLEGYIAAIYGRNRKNLECAEVYCHYKKPKIFLNDIAMRDDQFLNDVIALLIMLVATRTFAYYLLRWKLKASR